MALPILDAGVLDGGSDEQCLSFRDQLLSGLSTYGFVKLINHKIASEELSEVFRIMKLFFRLPYNVRKSLANDPRSGQQRGWSREGEEKTWWLESNKGGIAEPTFSDNKESFDHGPSSDTEFPNKWPPDACLPGFQSLMEDFFEHCGKLCLQLLELLTTALGLPPKTLTERCTNHASTVRINHFPPINVNHLDTGKISRIWPHYDFGIISLVFPDTVGGLEYEDRTHAGEFIPVEYGTRDEVVVTIGETFQRWTNNVVPAGLHRVTKPASVMELDGETVPERTSLVFFCKADRGVSVAPLPEFVNQQRPPVYDDITALEYQAQRNKAHYPEPQAVAVA